jgi:peroxiredoxin
VRKWVGKEMLRTLILAFFFASSVPQFQLRDTQGGVHTQAEWANQKAVLLFFITTDCPVGNSYVPEMNRLREAYAARGVAFYGVQADPTVANDVVAKYARDYRYTFPLLLDPAQILVRHSNATITPQVAILAPEGRVLYLGPIDNRVEDFGKTRPQATERYVRTILDSILTGKGVMFTTHKSIGCSITRKTVR